MAHHHDHDFFIPAPSIWAPLSCIGGGIMAFGFLFTLHPTDFGMSASIAHLIMAMGFTLLAFCVFQWWRLLVHEARHRGFKEGSVPVVLDLANRYGMVFFIASEVMFFAAFFAAFFYLSGMNVWPPENIETLTLHLPTVNTLLLLTSGVTVTWAHHAMQEGNRSRTRKMIFLTYLLGVIFLSCQMYEYHHASFALHDGVYGSTFYMLTGFHGFHVFVGSIMLMVLHLRLSQGDFSAKEHFYFEATAWYWHFVDVVWIGLYLFVYLLPNGGHH
ncbi:MAG: cytochrome c oxidase subunit 3 [Proteobacteria bacterium]|nr:cytochrome c oxidase subunit 3 [Pseudomonadota bacterium]